MPGHYKPLGLDRIAVQRQAQGFLSAGGPKRDIMSGRRMRRLAILLWATLLAAQQDVRNPRTTPEDVAAGAKTFRFHCAPCHGLHGEGGLGPNLAKGRFYHGSSDADLIKNISDGIPGTAMPGLFYNGERLWQIVAYIRSLNAPPAR